jgi:hypothetical protein
MGEHRKARTMKRRQSHEVFLWSDDEQAFVEYFVDSKLRWIRVGSVPWKDLDDVLRSRLREHKTVSWLEFDHSFVPAKTPVPLGHGEYVAPNSNAAGQFMFVQTLWKMVPDARTKLLALADDAQADVEAVRLWADRFSLLGDWLIDGAVLLVEAWRRSAESRGVIWQWTIPADDGWEGPIPRAWDPLIETEADYNAFLERYKSSVRATAEEKGLVKTPVKRHVDHFQWLVAHQVMGLSYSEIAERFGPASGLTESSVGQAIVETANQIGLTLRSAPKR